MFNLLYNDIPLEYYNQSKSIDNIVEDTFKLIGNLPDVCSYKTSKYKFLEVKENVLFVCLAPSIKEKDLDITIKSKILEIKTKEKEKDLPFFEPINLRLSLKKEINSKESFANLKDGVLTITMPLKKDKNEVKVNFK